MPITINTNVSAMISQRNLASSSMRSATALGKLSSGSRVPTAKEDAASLSIGTGIRADVSALRAAQVNAQQASSMLQIADGAFGQITDILVRMKSLTTTAQSGQLSATERGFLDTEYQELILEVDRIAASAQFNGVDLLGGQNSNSLDSAGSLGFVANGAAAGAGNNIDAENGFVGFDFADSVTAGDFYQVSFENATNTLTISRLDASGGNPVEAQSLVVSTPSAGTIDTYNFSDLGITLKLNDSFSNFVGADRNLGFGSTDYEFTSTATATAAALNVDFQVGATGSTGNDRITVNIALGNFAALIGGAASDITNVANATAASTEIDTAINAVNTQRATIGAALNRLEFANSNLAVSIENSEAARSTLMDVDVSQEITKFTSEQVLIQAGVSMLAQANQQPSLLLRLLQ